MPSLTLNWKRQLLLEKSVFGTSQHKALTALTLSAVEWEMKNCGDMGAPQEPHSSSKVAIHSEMVCMPLFCTQPIVPCGCYWGCVCVFVLACPFVFLYECLAYRGGWSGLDNILCDSTSGLAFPSSDIPPHYCTCNTLTVHSLCFVPVLVMKRMLWQCRSSVKLEDYQRERWKKKQHKQRTGFFCISLHVVPLWLGFWTDCKRSFSPYDEIIAGR